MDAADDDGWRVQIEAELTSASPNAGRLGAARVHAASAVSTAKRMGDRNLTARALGDALVSSVCTGEPMRQDMFARLSEMQDCTAMTVYHQPGTAMGLALYWAGDLEAARPLLERAAQQALARGQEWDRLGVLLTLAHLEWDAGNQLMAEQHRRAAEEALGEFGEGLLWLVVLDARYALERGDLAEARAQAERGLALAKRTSRAWQTPTLIQIMAEIELASGRPEAAHGRLEWIRDCLTSSGFGPAGQAKAVVWAQDVAALVASGRLEEAEEVLAELRSRAEVCDTPYVDALTSRSEGLLLAARGRARCGYRGHGPSVGCPRQVSPAVRARPDAPREGFDRTAGQAQGCGQANPRAGAGHARAARRAGLGLTDPRRAVPDRPTPGKSGRTA